MHLKGDKILLLRFAIIFWWWWCSSRFFFSLPHVFVYFNVENLEIWCGQAAGCPIALNKRVVFLPIFVFSDGKLNGLLEKIPISFSSWVNRFYATTISLWASKHTLFLTCFLFKKPHIFLKGKDRRVQGVLMGFFTTHHWLVTTGFNPWHTVRLKFARSRGFYHGLSTEISFDVRSCHWHNCF